MPGFYTRLLVLRDTGPVGVFRWQASLLFILQVACCLLFAGSAFGKFSVGAPPLVTVLLSLFVHE